MSEEVNIPGLTGEPEVPAEQPEQPLQAEPAPETEEVITLRFKGEEKHVPKHLISELAERIGADEYTTIMRVQKMWDADRVYRDTEREREEWGRKEAEYNARMQALEAERQRQYGQPQRQQPVADDDPIAILRNLQQRFDTVQQAWESEREQYKAALAEQFQADQAAQVQAAYDQLVEKVKSDPRKLPVIPFEDLEREAVESGLASNRRLSWGQVLERSYRNLAWDYVPRAVEKSTLDKLRDPKASITVPGGRSAPPAPPPSANPLEGMKWGDVIDSIPRAR